ncbi:MAG: hypothetical protein H6834_09280 [Planctomycetes bacterium]|nr:hypothetical protein [Planctomycetota bacterium]
MSEGNLTDRAADLIARHLVGGVADDLVRERYAQFVRSKAPRARTSFDRRLFAFAMSGRVPLLLADEYAARFARLTPLRAHLVAMLALLESRSPYAERLERVDPGGRLVFFARSFVRGVRALGVLALATLILGPVHLLSRRARHGGTR